MIWRQGTHVSLSEEILTPRVRFPAGAGGRAQAGFAWAADGKEAGSIAVLSALGALSYPSFPSIGKKKRSRCPLHLLASKPLPLFSQGH